jgi:hypothetical protein
VLTYTIVRVPLNPAFADVPYGLAIAETTDGVRMLAQVDKRDLDELRIGAAVEVRYRPVSESISLPYFSILEEAL